MTRRSRLSWALCAAGLFAATGCSSMPSVVRGQSPEAAPIQQTAHHQHQVQQHTGPVANAYSDHHSTTTTYRSATYSGKDGSLVQPVECTNCPGGHAGAGAGAAGQGYYGTCPPGSNCRHHGMGHGLGHGLHGGYHCPHHGLCPSGHCRSCGHGNALDWYPKHHFSYSYERPRNLVYPPPQVPGGAVVYPYYTHKGPSDFFRAE